MQIKKKKRNLQKFRLQLNNRMRILLKAPEPKALKGEKAYKATRKTDGLQILHLTTSSFRNPQGSSFAGATCDLLLPMLSKPIGFHLSVFTFQFSVFTFPLSPNLALLPAAPARCSIPLPIPCAAGRPHRHAAHRRQAHKG